MARNIKYIHSDYLIHQADQHPKTKGRASLTHNLIQSYGLLNHMERIKPVVCNQVDLKAFHTLEYLQQLDTYEEQLEGNVVEDVEPEEQNGNVTLEDDEEQQDSPECLFSDVHGLSYDCPPWPGVRPYVCHIGGSTMTACDLLCKSRNKQDVFLNWCGGWHHARRGRAAGFCYVNDVALGILVLTMRFRRILYIDLDNHHGDGVERAFIASRRIFCLSFHQFDYGYYPGTGTAMDKGHTKALGYTANFPYKRGITGERYIRYFKRICSLVVSTFKPEVFVVQCGADAVVGDPLGGTNLVPEDLIQCVKFILDYELPCVLLGGGGYNFTNASRYWTLLTAAVCGVDLDDDIPADNEDFLKYGPGYCLKIHKSTTLTDCNSEEYLEEQAAIIEDNLKLCRVRRSN